MSSSVVTTTMMRLPAEKLEAIQAEFEEEEEGLTVHQFVAVMAKYLNLEADLAALDLDDVVDGALESQARQDAEAEAVLQELAMSNGDAVPVTAMPSASVLSPQPSTLTATRGGGEGSATLEVVSDLCELFAQIDANGDGTLEWDEFTNFVIEQGVALEKDHAFHDHFVKREGQSPFGARSSEDKYEVHSMRYFPEVQRLFVCVDNKVEILDVYARSDLMRQGGLRLLHEIVITPTAGEDTEDHGEVVEEDDENAEGGGAGGEAGGGPTATHQQGDGVASLVSGGAGTVDSSVVAAKQAEERQRKKEEKELKAAERRAMAAKEEIKVLDCVWAEHSRAPPPVGTSSSITAAAGDAEAAEIKTMATLDNNDETPDYMVLIVLSSDLALSFWSFRSKVSLNGGTIKPGGRHVLPLQQIRLCWCAYASTLFTSGFAPEVSAWRVSAREGAGGHCTFSVAERGRLDGGGSVSGGQGGTYGKPRHRDVVQTFLCIEGAVDPETGTIDTLYLVTGGLDHKVLVWDPRTLEHCFELKGHRGGVRSMSWDASQGLLLTCGFEYDIKVWGLISRRIYFFYHLKGHRRPLIWVDCAVGHDRAVSLDESGKIIWWDTRKETLLGEHERALQSFTVDTEIPSMISVVYDATDEGLGGQPSEAARWSANEMSLMASGRRLHLFDSVNLAEATSPPTAVAFNPTSLTVAAAHDDYVNVWDACSGELLRVFEHITSGGGGTNGSGGGAVVVPTTAKGALKRPEITAMAFDVRMRKLLVADQSGAVTICNYLNGAVMSRVPSHAAEVSCLCYGPSDGVAVTASWDRCLRVYDVANAKLADVGSSKGDATALLREVRTAHGLAGDVSCMAVSEVLGLVATSATDGSLRLWDLQFMTLEGDSGRVPFTPPPAMETHKPESSSLEQQQRVHSSSRAHRSIRSGGIGGGGQVAEQEEPGVSYKERRAKAREERAAKAKMRALHEATDLAAPMRKKLKLVCATAMCFLEPYPLLAVGDSEGFLSFYLLRPHADLANRNNCVLRFRNMRRRQPPPKKFKTVRRKKAKKALLPDVAEAERSGKGGVISGEGEGEGAGAGAVTAAVTAAVKDGDDEEEEYEEVQVEEKVPWLDLNEADEDSGDSVGISRLLLRFDPLGGKEIGGPGSGIFTGRHLLYVGTTGGTVVVHDIGAVISHLKLTAVPEAKLPRSAPNYNPRRRVVKDMSKLAGGKAGSVNNDDDDDDDDGDGPEGSLASKGSSSSSSSSSGSGGGGGGGKGSADGSRPAWNPSRKGAVPESAPVVAKREKGSGRAGKGSGKAGAASAPMTSPGGTPLTSTGMPVGAASSYIRGIRTNAQLQMDARGNVGFNPGCFSSGGTGEGGGAPNWALCWDSWTAHGGSIVSMELISDPPCLLTAGADGGIKVWALHQSVLVARSDSSRLSQTGVIAPPLPHANPNGTKAEPMRSGGGALPNNDEEGSLASASTSASTASPSKLKRGSSGNARERKLKELEEKRRRMPGMPKFPGKGLRKPKYAALARAKGAVLSRKFFRETPTQHWLLGTLTTGQEDKTELRLGGRKAIHNMPAWRFPVDLDARHVATLQEARGILADGRRREEAAAGGGGRLLLEGTTRTGLATAVASSKAPSPSKIDTGTGLASRSDVGSARSSPTSRPKKVFTFDEDSIAAAGVEVASSKGGGSKEANTPKSGNLTSPQGTMCATPKDQRLNTKGERLTGKQEKLRDFGAQLGNTLPPRRQREVGRIFGQLAGGMTWKRSTHEIAREEAARSYHAAQQRKGIQGLLSSSSSSPRSSSRDGSGDATVIQSRRQNTGEDPRTRQQEASREEEEPNLDDYYQHPQHQQRDAAAGSIVSGGASEGLGSLVDSVPSQLQESSSSASEQLQQPRQRRRRRRQKQRLKTKEELVKEIDDFLRPKFDATTRDLMEDARLEREAEAKAAVAAVVAKEMAASNAAAARQRRKAAAAEDDDPESWGIASLNRQRQMYRNMHVEREREGKEAEAGSRRTGAKSKQELEVLTAPSPFLLAKFPELRISKSERSARRHLRLSKSTSAPALYPESATDASSSVAQQASMDLSSVGVYSHDLADNAANNNNAANNGQEGDGAPFSQIVSSTAHGGEDGSVGRNQSQRATKEPSRDPPRGGRARRKETTAGGGIGARSSRPPPSQQREPLPVHPQDSLATTYTALSVSKSETGEALKMANPTGGAPLVMREDGLGLRPLKPSESAPALKHRGSGHGGGHDNSAAHQKGHAAAFGRSKGAAGRNGLFTQPPNRAFMTPRSRWNLGPDATLEDLMGLAQRQADVHNAWRQRVEHFLAHHEDEDEAYFKAQATASAGAKKANDGVSSPEEAHTEAMNLRHELMHRHDAGVMKRHRKGGGVSTGVAAFFDFKTGALKAHIGAYSTTDLLKLFRACRVAHPPHFDPTSAHPLGSSATSPTRKKEQEAAAVAAAEEKSKRLHIGLNDDEADDEQYPPQRRMVDLTVLLGDAAPPPSSSSSSSPGTGGGASRLVQDELVRDALTRLRRRYVGKAGHTLEAADAMGHLAVASTQANNSGDGGPPHQKHKHEKKEKAQQYVEHVVLATVEDVFRSAFPLLRATEAKDAIGAVHAHEKADREMALHEEHINAQAIERIPEHKLRQLRALFTLYDIDGSGLVSASEIATALQTNHRKHFTARDYERGDADDISSVLSLQEIDALVQRFDRDGNRELDETEFILAFQDVI